MIILRLAAGIKEHFRLRFTEWLGCAVLFGWSLGLATQPDTFSLSPSFEILASYGSPLHWAIICQVAAVVRLIALGVNGTFRTVFPYAPHLRAAASLFAVIFWGQVTVGVLVAFFGGGAVTGIIAYAGYTVLELWNFFHATAEAVEKQD